MIEAKNLVLKRGGRKILDGVSLMANAGDFVAVIGPNGAGKSTLLSLLAGLTKPDSGAVLLDGRSLSLISGRELAKLRAYLPQNPVCEWPISVERLVGLGLLAHLPVFGGLPKSFAPAIDAALAATDLSDRRDQPATTLSGGEMARAMLARAMVGTPDILIVDEPVTGLDPRHAMDAMARLSAYAKSGKLVIASLHDLTLAARYTSWVVALKEGRLAGEGRTEEALTDGVIRDVFGVRGAVRGQGANAAVDLFSPE